MGVHEYTPQDRVATAGRGMPLRQLRHIGVPATMTAAGSLIRARSQWGAQSVPDMGLTKNMLSPKKKREPRDSRYLGSPTVRDSVRTLPRARAWHTANFSHRCVNPNLAKTGSRPSSCADSSTTLPARSSNFLFSRGMTVDLKVFNCVPNSPAATTAASAF
jgi:hypothetical protein